MNSTVTLLGKMPILLQYRQWQPGFKLSLHGLAHVKLCHTEKLLSFLMGMADKAGQFGGAIREDSRKTRPRAGQLTSTLHASDLGDSEEIVCVFTVSTKKHHAGKAAAH